MRHCTPFVVIGLMLAVPVSQADEPPKLEQEADRIGYSLGHQIGMDFKRQGVALDSAALARGIEDALAGAEPLLPGEDMEQRLLTLKGQITEDMLSDQQNRYLKRIEERERKQQEAKTFLEENAKKPGVETHPSGLQYRVIREGSGVTPTRRDQVTIHVSGRRINGEEFDSSYKDGKPRTVRVADMIPGIREAILMMQPGAKWELYIPPELAYRRDTPLGYQAVIVELELLGVGGANQATQTTSPASPQDARPDGTQ
jgi:FKBP-type peptidyl-prolyl cis-trans isomerase FklB